VVAAAAATVVLELAIFLFELVPLLVSSESGGIGGNKGACGNGR